MLEPRFVEGPRSDASTLAAQAAGGLLAHPARVAPKFLYDELGCRLFEAITALDEYYPTRTEAAIFAAHGEAICRQALAFTGPRPALVDLGAGNCAKAARLFAALAPRCYVAVDLALDYLRGALTRLQREQPTLPMVGVGLDFGDRLHLDPGIVGGPALVFYPGSSIGNFAPDDARRLLREARELAAGGGLLVGADLLKAPVLLHAAYDDALGVTAAFDLNLLRHLNRLLDADFDLSGWQHEARFDADAARVQMHLRARRDCVVRWAGAERRFAGGERIHTEDAYKWSPDSFASLLREAGWGEVRCWTDPRGWFGVFLASA